MDEKSFGSIVKYHLLRGGGGIACGDVILIDHKGRKYNKLSQHFTGCIANLSNLDKIKISLYGRNLYQGGCMLIHKSFFSCLFPVPEKIFAHDTWFFFVAAYTDSFHYTPEILSQYRQHSQSTSGNQLNKISLKKRTLAPFFQKTGNLRKNLSYTGTFKKKFQL